MSTDRQPSTITRTATFGMEVVDLVDRSREIKDAVAARQAAVIEAEAAEQAAAAEADRLAAEAAQARKMADRGENKPLSATMREVGDAIDAARQAALDAIKAGEDPAGAWVLYRMECAHQAGIWAQFSAKYHQLTGKEAPPGPLHRIRPLPSPGQRGEGFEQFLIEAMRTIETEIEHATRRATMEAMWAADAADNGASSGPDAA